MAEVTRNPSTNKSRAVLFVLKAQSGRPAGARFPLRTGRLSVVGSAPRAIFPPFFFRITTPGTRFSPLPGRNKFTKEANKLKLSLFAITSLNYIVFGSSARLRIRCWIMQIILPLPAAGGCITARAEQGFSEMHTKRIVQAFSKYIIQMNCNKYAAPTRGSRKSCYLSNHLLRAPN